MCVCVRVHMCGWEALWPLREDTEPVFAQRFEFLSCKEVVSGEALSAKIPSSLHNKVWM